MSPEHNGLEIRKKVQKNNVIYAAERHIQTFQSKVKLQFLLRMIAQCDVKGPEVTHKNYMAYLSEI